MFHNKHLYSATRLMLYIYIFLSFFSQFNIDNLFIDIISQFGFYLIFFGLLLLLYFLFLKRKLISFITFLVTLFLTISIYSSCVNCSKSQVEKTQNSNQIKILIFNTGLINDISSIKKLVLIEKPDLIQFQELSPKLFYEINQLKNYYSYSAGLDQNYNIFSSVIFSNFPLQNINIDKHHVISANMKIKNKDIKIFGVHFFPPLNNSMVKIYLSLHAKFGKIDKPQKIPIMNLSIILNQIKNLKNLVKKNNSMIIVMGDLNMTSSSKRFKNFLNQTNLYTYLSVKKLTSTWPSFLPSFLGVQIDHVLFSNHFSMIDKKTTSSSGSDHRPLVVNLAF